LVEIPEQETGGIGEMTASVHHERPGRGWRGDEDESGSSGKEEMEGEKIVIVL
jgi:hypothetical protein